MELLVEDLYFWASGIVDAVVPLIVNGAAHRSDGGAQGWQDLGRLGVLAFVAGLLGC